MDDPVLRIKLEGDPSPDASVNPQQQPPQTGLPNAPEQQSQLLDLQRIPHPGRLAKSGVEKLVQAQHRCKRIIKLPKIKNPRAGDF